MKDFTRSAHAKIAAAKNPTQAHQCLLCHKPTKADRLTALGVEICPDCYQVANPRNLVRLLGLTGTVATNCGVVYARA